MSDPARELLRHTVATIAYRAGKTLRDVPDSFSAFRASEDSRPAGAILAHMGDLFDWALSIAEGNQRWADAPQSSWSSDSQRFFAALQKFDDYLASDRPLGGSVGKLFQGPVADALTHTGQIALLRRLAGIPIRAENYARAGIETGRVGAEQAVPRMEF